MNTVAQDTVVSLDLTLHDAQGELIHASEAPVAYLHGGYGGMFEALESALEGKRAGDTVDVQLEPDEAFGDYDAQLVRVGFTTLQYWLVVSGTDANVFATLLRGFHL